MGRGIESRDIPYFFFLSMMFMIKVCEHLSIFLIWELGAFFFSHPFSFFCKTGSICSFLDGRYDFMLFTTFMLPCPSPTSYHGWGMRRGG